LTYLDSEDDRITMTNNDDLQMALTSTTLGQTLKVHVDLKQSVCPPVATAAVDPVVCSLLPGFGSPEEAKLSVDQQRSDSDQQQPEICKVFQAVRPWRYSKLLQKLAGDTEQMAIILGNRWNQVITECDGDMTKVQEVLLQRKQQQHRRHHNAPASWNLTDELKEKVAKLEEMGYNNRPRNVKLLRKFDGDLDKVVAKFVQKADKLSKKAAKKAAKTEKKSLKKAKKAAKKADKETKKAEKLLSKCALTSESDETFSSSSSSSSSSDSSGSSSDSDIEFNHHGKRPMSQFPKGGRKLMKRLFKAEKRLHHASMELFGAFGHGPHHMHRPHHGPPFHGPPHHGPPFHGHHGKHHRHRGRGHGRRHGPHHQGPHHGPEDLEGFVAV
jgi:hypothetical protein